MSSNLWYSTAVVCIIQMPAVGLCHFMHKLQLLRSNCLFHDVSKGFNSDMQAFEASVCRLEGSIVLRANQSLGALFAALGCILPRDVAGSPVIFQHMQEARGGLERHFYLAGLELATGPAWRLWPCSVVSDGSKGAS